MKIIIDGRGTGKAKQLLEAAAQTENSAILTQDKRALEVKANSYGIKDVKIFDYEDLENDEIGIYTNLYIHNADKFLVYILNRYYALKLGGFTATLEVE